MKRLFAFLAIFLLLAGCASRDPFAQYGSVREKIGFLAHTDITWPKSTAALLKALQFYRQQGVDAIVFVGDPTKNGYKNQMEVFDIAWQTAFRGVTPPKRILAKDPYVMNGISFTADGNFPLTDLMCVQPKDGRMVNVGSMNGIKVSGIFSRVGQKPSNTTVPATQGLLVLRHDEGMTIRRLDFSRLPVEDVGAPWIVDAQGLILAERDKAPEFWPDTRVAVIRGYDKNGNVLYTLRWPPVLEKYTGARAFSYEVSVGDNVLRNVQSKGFYLPESRDTEVVTCVIWEDELKGAKPRFGITPLSSLGKAGRTIWAE